MNKEDFAYKLHRVKRESTPEYYIGLLTSAIYSKKLFAKNADIDEFLVKIFNITYLPYVFHSRTNVVARLSKDLLILDKKQHDESVNEILEYFDLRKDSSNSKNKTSKNISKWVQGIRNEGK